MLTAVIAAELLSPSPSPASGSTHDAYSWWADIWLPTIVGVGSILVAVVAIAVARRSNRFARQATKAAERSNAIAKRAIDLENERARDATRREEQLDRQAFADRYLAALLVIVEEVRLDPQWWVRPRESPSPELGRLTAFLFEAMVLEYNDFPDARSMHLVRTAAEAEIGHGVVMSAYSYANAATNMWVRKDSRMGEMITYWEKALKDEIEEVGRENRS